MTHPAPDLTKLSDIEIIEHLLAAEADKTAADLAAKKLKDEILNRKAAELSAGLGNKGGFGIVNIPIGGEIAKIDTPKKVDWDQKILEELYNQIAADNIDPKQFIKVEYTVSETLFKEWGDNMKAAFIPARTVKAGNPSIKITEKE